MKSGSVIDSKRIVFVNRYFHPDESATSQLLSDLAFGLAQNGIKVAVVCSRQLYGRADAKLAHMDSVQGVIVRRVWTTRFGRDGLIGRAIDYASFCVSSLFTLVKLLKSGDTVVAKTDPPLISVVVMMAASIKKARLVNWLQDVFPEVADRLGANPLPGGLSRWLSAMRDRSLRAASMNIVLGERMRGVLMQRGISTDKIAIVENWAIRDPDASGNGEASRLRAKLGLERAFVLGYSGNLGRAHDFETLLRAAALLRQRRDIRFLMIGGGAGMTALKKEVLSLGLDNFRFLDYQPQSELSDSLAASDVHLVSLLPALEGLIVPSKFYGILAAGRPVVFVGDADGELARVIREFKLGAAVSVGEAEALALELETRARDRRICRDEGMRGLRLYESRYSSQRALKLWTQILGARSVSPPLTLLNPAAAAWPPSPSNR